MLKISTKKSREPLRLALGGGSALVLRRADAFDQIAAETQADAAIAAILAGGETIAEYSLGEDEDGGERDINALREILVEVEIAMRVVSGIENIEIDDVAQTAPNRPLFAALFRETWALNAFRAKSRGDIHQRTLVGNGSERSQNGEPAAASPIADPAQVSEPPARADSEAKAESAAPSENMAA